MADEFHSLSFFKKIAIWPIYAILRMWHSTIRVVISKKSEIALMPKNESCAMLFWHNQLFIAPKLRNIFRKDRTMYGLVSTSKDGAWLVELLKKFNILCIRGSSSKRGKQAIIEMKDIKASKICDIVITPDGPRGPKYKCKKGSIKFLSEENMPVILLHVEQKSSWSLSSWDSFIIPKPFSTVHVHADYLESLPKLPESDLIAFVEMALSNDSSDA